MNALSNPESDAFIAQFTLPPTHAGPLDGLRFAVKDLIDVAGHRTGCGNPDWLATHPAARVSAVCVEQLLAAGAACAGKTVTDEVAFSLLGENYFYGTPLNPAAPDRVPGGSSSGSASAVACRLLDFALGTDTGGSVRIPASNCGVWGMRPSHDAISVAGVMPFAPTFDTVGVLARTSDVLERAMGVLLGGEKASVSGTTGSASAAVDEKLSQTCKAPSPGDGGEGIALAEPVAPEGFEPPVAIHLIPEAFALADVEVRQALEAPIVRLREKFGASVRETSLAELCRDAEAGDHTNWLHMYQMLQGVEIDSCLGAWIAATHPKFGPSATASFELVYQLDRTRVGEAVRLRERFSRELQAALGPRDLLCIPTAPTLAPIKGTASHDRRGDYYKRTLSLTSIAGAARLPQVSMPLANVNGVPIGLSLVAARGEDVWLLRVARMIDVGWLGS